MRGGWRRWAATGGVWRQWQERGDEDWSHEGRGNVFGFDLIKTNVKFFNLK